MTSVKSMGSSEEQTKKDILNKIKINTSLLTHNDLERMFPVLSQDKESMDKLFLILNDFRFCYDSTYQYLFFEDCIFYVLKLYYEASQGGGQEIQNKLLEELKQIDQIKMNNLHIGAIYSFNNEVLSIKSKLDDYKKEAQSISYDLQNKWKLSSFAGSFQKIATSERIAKIIWVILAFAFSAVATYFVLCSSYRMIVNEFNIPLVEFLQKLANTIFLYAMAFWCGKRYYICRSQEISYRHTAAILNVYDMFKTTFDKEEKHIVITEMAHAIFTPPLLPNMKTIENSDWQKILDIIKITTTKEIKG